MCVYCLISHFAYDKVIVKCDLGSNKVSSSASSSSQMCIYNGETISEASQSQQREYTPCTLYIDDMCSSYGPVMQSTTL